jgi:oxygen-independent coproporphyrinogen-3 oxidase
MAGIYIHIPFCKQACTYCDFHFSTSLKRKDELLQALQKEIAQRTPYLEGELIRTVYFGGGTPSLLSAEEINEILHNIHNHFSTALEEITLEANPDDLNRQKLQELKQTAINRLSIGVQSFNPSILSMMNRAHNQKQAINSIKDAQDAGFENLSLDLIYGNPGQSISEWENDLQQFFALQVPHLSAYSLTIEPQTRLHYQIGKGKIPIPNDGVVYEHYQLLQQYIDHYLFEQYEVSSYCRDKRYARHNSSYWKGEKYLGIGPSAHSYNGLTRQWNVRNNAVYIKSVEQGLPYSEKEELSEVDRYHEFLLTGLRTRWGCDLRFLHGHFSDELTTHFHKALEQVENSYWRIENHHLIINRHHLFQSDEVIKKLMF